MNFLCLISQIYNARFLYYHLLATMSCRTTDRGVQIALAAVRNSFIGPVPCSQVWCQLISKKGHLSVIHHCTDIHRDLKRQSAVQTINGQNIVPQGPMYWFSGRKCIPSQYRTTRTQEATALHLLYFETAKFMRGWLLWVYSFKTISQSIITYEKCM